MVRWPVIAGAAALLVGCAGESDAQRVFAGGTYAKNLGITLVVDSAEADSSGAKVQIALRNPSIDKVLFDPTRAKLVVDGVEYSNDRSTDYIGLVVDIGAGGGESSGALVFPDARETERTTSSISRPTPRTRPRRRGAPDLGRHAGVAPLAGFGDERHHHSRDDEETNMAIVSSFDYAPFDESDPDDFRPNSRWAVLVDPGGDPAARVDDITLIVEEIAPGDRIPLHTHPINEVIVILEGSAEVTLGDDAKRAGPDSVVFIPAGTPHGTRNTGTTPIRLHAMFPSEQIGIQYLERNPAPGTEADAPKPAFTIDARTLSEA